MNSRGVTLIFAHRQPIQYSESCKGDTMKYSLAAFAAILGIVACGGNSSTGTDKPIKPVTPVASPPSVTLTTPSKVEYAAKFVAAWQSQNAKVCSAPWTVKSAVSGSDSVSLTGSGWLPISCTGVGGTTKDSVYVTVNPQPRTVLVIVKYVVTEGTTYLVPTVPLVLRNGTKVDTTFVVETASFKAPSLYSDTVSFSIEGNTSYFPIGAKVPKALFQSAGTVDTISIVRIPREWTVERGLYKGTKIAVSLIAAYDTTPEGSSFLSRATFAGNQSKEFGYYRYGWSNLSLPAKVVFDRTLTVSPITATDSTNLWKSLVALEEKYGRNLFYAGEKTAKTNQIEVYIGAYSKPSGGGTSGINDPLSLAGATYTTTLTSRFNSLYEVEHEVLGHGFGHGHTCAWVSTMKSGCPPYTQPIVYPEPQIDVAYFELQLAVDDVRRSIKAKYHWGENLNGERRGRGLLPETIRYTPYVSSQKIDN